MENKPPHYDGSIQNNNDFKSEANNSEVFELTDEMRKNISGNPYMSNITE
jgi:hypothetical protein